MNEKYKKELKEFDKYDFPKFVLSDLYEYYKVKEAYIEKHEDNFIEQKYDMIYTSLKSQWVCGKISEHTFWSLVKILKKGVNTWRKANNKYVILYDQKENITGIAPIKKDFQEIKKFVFEMDRAFAIQNRTLQKESIVSMEEKSKSKEHIKHSRKIEDMNMEI